MNSYDVIQGYSNAAYPNQEMRLLLEWIPKIKPEATGFETTTKDSSLPDECCKVAIDLL